MSNVAKIPLVKPPVRTKKWEELDPADDSIWQAKLDGAFLYLTFDKKDGVRAFSYRRSKRDGKPIEHTNKIYGLKRMEVPDYLDGAILAGEAWHPDLASRQIGGILNTRKEELPESLFVALHGVDRIKNTSGVNLSVGDQLKILGKVHSELPYFELPDTAVTPESKKLLKEKIEKGTHPQTNEGIMVYYPKDDKYPYKAVREPTIDLPVVGTTEGTGRLEGAGVGAILVGTPENPTAVGSGLSDKVRSILHKHPDIVDGLVARVKLKETFPSGKLRAPVLRDFHPEKSDPTKLRRLESYLTKEAKIKEEEGKYVLYTSDGSRVLGRHDTREKALRQERAIQMSKRFRSSR